MNLYDIDFISERISYLRNKKEVSARDMSLSLGQGVNYINAIENKRSAPSMSGFLAICEYFRMTPSEFFETIEPKPDKMIEKISLALPRFNATELKLVLSFVEEIDSHK